jgi:hypothetical protein
VYVCFADVRFSAGRLLCAGTTGCNAAAGHQVQPNRCVQHAADANGVTMAEAAKIDQLLPVLPVTCKNGGMRALRILECLSLLPIAALCACATGDHATVTIAYQARSQNEWQVTPPARQRIAMEFKRIARDQGYQCNERGKRTEEIICTGPKRMRVTFAPELNRPEYRIHLDWLEVGDRTAAEFQGHVSRLAAAMTAAVPDVQVEISEGRDARREAPGG